MTPIAAGASQEPVRAGLPATPYLPAVVAERQPAEAGPTLEALRVRRDELLALAARRGAHNVRVFGSIARGEATPVSDVDFLVDLEPERTLFDLSELVLDFEAALGRRVDVIESGVQRGSRTATAVLGRICREAVPL